MPRPPLDTFRTNVQIALSDSSELCSPSFVPRYQFRHERVDFAPSYRRGVSFPWNSRLIYRYWQKYEDNSVTWRDHARLVATAMKSLESIRIFSGLLACLRRAPRISRRAYSLAAQSITNACVRACNDAPAAPLCECTCRQNFVDFA